MLHTQTEPKNAETECLHIQLIDAKHMIDRLRSALESHGCHILTLERDNDLINTTVHVTVRSQDAQRLDLMALLNDIVGVCGVDAGADQTRH